MIERSLELVVVSPLDRSQQVGVGVLVERPRSGGGQTGMCFFNWNDYERSKSRPTRQVVRRLCWTARFETSQEQENEKGETWMVEEEEKMDGWIDKKCQSEMAKKGMAKNFKMRRRGHLKCQESCWLFSYLSRDLWRDKRPDFSRPVIHGNWRSLGVLVDGRSSKGRDILSNTSSSVLTQKRCILKGVRLYN